MALENGLDKFKQFRYTIDNIAMQKYQRLAKIALNKLNFKEDAKIVAILGSRQVGKTTLLIDFSLDWKGKVIKYLGDRLEDALLWKGKFSDLKNKLEVAIGCPLEKIDLPVLLIFDEVQKIPEAFNNLKILHDEFKEKIKIAISGSSSLSLLHRTSESLGGRVEIVNMYPLSFTEILSGAPRPLWMEKSRMDFETIRSEALGFSDANERAENVLDKALSYGLFPEAYLQDNIDEVKLLHQNYHQTYIEKDVRDLREVGNVLDFDLVWKIAHRTCGQILNYTNISRETGLAFNTVKKYISVLIASFNVCLLPSFCKDIRSRLVKSPKLFSVDIGFFNHCLNLYGKANLISSQLVGRTFESLMVSEFFKQERSYLFGGEPYFFRTAAGAEVDLVVEQGLDLFAYEFKYSEKVTNSDFSGIRSLMELSKGRLKRGFVLSRQSHAEKFADNLFAVPWWFFCSVN
ncbi:hypothetical protein A2276_07990 [candidate division WOR-1 bacterium RIFOXYA12_FULL_43_27]|uniref:AAA+ ATPase domain-containing protein n=1 Tax=candidate division WOR-1 bacterium RIFOXYC2_FULL_46_14 TaxID=1802587 RepID=A0A1F4U650_UNCSA|nr:MAG: hypothetical protein A2276_07990 [candidate division WOR-1 bacterium RIFOXYA12_FULL_43_27]OGC20538.1 MAG: hypothetical protein A2292_05815 [candidate division WOR-1 bacterium RIFOXYB2_FULL_46_45]OGC31725.1 MAG: hypothetical protein A2232_05635 [candidate division WOR-1 bacterium RIFOXYA2_FULL_46_56]OGC40381.1 MAG: hypothetical protein A2438_03840 [candidate division WOR-1 bacterium RIFOXYC2_FULL_46_14]